MRKCPSMILIITSICALLITSCSKDSDLLSEYVIQDNQNTSLKNVLVNDTFTTTYNSTIILDVLANDNITNIENIKITSTTNPKFGAIEILEDNTLKFVVQEMIPVEETAAVGTTDQPAEEETVAPTEETIEETIERAVTETIVYTIETINTNNTVQTDSATVIVTIEEQNTNQFNLLSVNELAAKADFAIYNRLLPAVTNDYINQDYNGEYGRILRICGNGDQGDIYNLDVLQGMVALFEATGDKKYLNDVIAAYTILIKAAKPSKDLPQSGASYSDDYLSWYGNPNTNLTKTGILGQQQLSESRSFMHLSRLLWVMYHSPNLRGEINNTTDNSYQQEFELLLDFLQINFWDKWFSRNSLIFQHSGVDSSAAWAFIAWNLWDITNNNKFKTIYDRFNEDIGIAGVNGGMRQHLDANTKNSSAYQWNTSFNDNTYQGRSVTDHGHAARVVKFMVEDYTIGSQFYNESDMQKLINSISVFWPNSLEAEGEIYYWMDGEFQTGYAKKRNFMPEGWMSLGRFDETLQSRFEKMFTGYFDENRTEGVFWGELAYNKAFLEGSIKYPENK